MNQKILTSLTLLYFMFYGMLGVHSDFSDKPYVFAAGATHPSSVGAESISSDWRNDQWTGDDRPFHLARRSIDRLFNVGMAPSAIVAKYQDISEAHPTNALDAFQYAYAAIKQQWGAPHPSLQNDSDAITAMLNADPPHTFDFTRLLFLLMADSRNSIQVGKRLYDADPNDTQVAMMYALALSDSKSKDDARLSDQIADSILVNQPVDAIMYYHAMWIYGDIGETMIDPSSYVKSIAAGQKFLSLTPSYDCFRPATMHCIAVLQLRLKAMGAQ
jgi:hypothetical protein